MSQALLSPYPNLIFRRSWTVRDLLASFRHPGRPTGTLAVPWVDELLQKRFACVLACQPCTWKYSDAFRRHDYRRDHEFVAIARCDFCKREDRKLWMYYAEEKFSRLRSTQEGRHAEFRRGATLATGGIASRYDNGGIKSWKL